MLRIETRGGAWERGRQQGEQSRRLAEGWLRSSLSRLAAQRRASSWGALVGAVSGEVRRWIDQWAAVYPAGVEECRGIAAGLGWDEDLYLGALCHHRLSGELPQCTLVGRHQGGSTRFGKTDDIERHQLGLNLLEISRPTDGHDHLHFHFAATPWTVAGANQPGLAMGMTGIPGPMKEEAGLFSLMALRTVLPACADVGEALEHLRDLPVNAYGFSLMLGDAGGRLALVEKTGAGMTVVEAEDGRPLGHTNHILDADFARLNPAQGAPIDANGRRRLDNALRLAGEGVPIERILADRSSVGAICQQGEDGLHTDFAVLFEPVEGRMRLWSGPPARVEPAEYDFERLLA
ncbi:MAG: C45 family autoproteolytic acyltransferase/hydrolase [Gemmatimonadaceae bacterium]|nr:C45 family autoproteolytic acyltransferase/hydrolase [Gemmatimonadaceae bacterium]